jgi:hypothetical protein
MFVVGAHEEIIYSFPYKLYRLSLQLQLQHHVYNIRTDSRSPHMHVRYNYVQYVMVRKPPDTIS